MRKVKWALALVGAALVLIVAAQNNRPVIIDVLFWRAEVDRLLLFPALFLLGLVAGFLLGWGWERRKGRRKSPVAAEPPPPS
jgi:uncharacterized integral membrane protein